LLFLTKARAKVRIYDQVAKRKSSIGETVYRIKIINKTCRPIINIKAQLHLVTPTVMPDGIIKKSRDIPLKRSEKWKYQNLT
jgi:hypothetical protein